MVDGWRGELRSRPTLGVCDFFKFARERALKTKDLSCSKSPKNQKSHKLSANRRRLASRGARLLPAVAATNSVSYRASLWCGSQGAHLKVSATCGSETLALQQPNDAEGIGQEKIAGMVQPDNWVASADEHFAVARASYRGHWLLQRAHR
jgi:hypothetical protein